MTTDKEKAILDAAQTQFLRYGYRRVTMADIAAAAGMSRPALYLLFSNKEAIFSGVFARYAGAQLADIKKGVDDFQTVSERLTFAVEIWTIQSYELIHGTPEGQELAECSFGFAADIVLDSYERFEAIVEAILAPHVSKRARGAENAATLAQMFALSLRGIKSGARDAKHLRELATSLISVTTSALSESSNDEKVDPVAAGAI